MISVLGPTNSQASSAMKILNDVCLKGIINSQMCLRASLLSRSWLPLTAGIKTGPSTYFDIELYYFWYLLYLSWHLCIGKSYYPSYFKILSNTQRIEGLTYVGNAADYIRAWLGKKLMIILAE